MATHRFFTTVFAPACAALGLLLVMTLAAPLAAWSASIVLTWDSVGQDVSYRIYYGTASGSYTASVDAGQATTCVIGNVSEGDVYYIAAATYQGEIQSELSQEMNYLVPVLDSDGDGLSDEEEAHYGTDPYRWDTDGDGISDYQEVLQWGSAWNADNDGDGLINILDPTPDGTAGGSGPTTAQRRQAAQQAIRILLLDS